MKRYKIIDVAVEVSERENNPSTSGYERFVGLEHYISGEVKIVNYGSCDKLDSAMKVFRSGDILIARRNVYLKRASVVNFDGLTSGDSIVLRVEDEQIARLLPFVLNTDAFWDYADQHSDGTMSKRLSPKTLMQYEFDLPDEDQQRQLADTLWAAAETKASYQHLLTQTDELVRAQFVEMFGDPVLNDKGWPIVTLGDVSELRIGPFGTMLHKSDYIVGGHAVVNPSHISNGNICIDKNLTVSDDKYEELSAYKLEVGDVVLGRRGEMGRCAVVYETGLLCGTGSIIIRPNDRMKSYFLQNILSSATYKKVMEDNSVGVTMMNLNIPIVSNLPIPEWPINIQERFISFIEQSDKAKLELKQAIDCTATLIKSLMQQDFNS